MLCFTLLLSVVMQTALCQMDFTGHKLLALSSSNNDGMEFLQKLSENIHMDTWNFPVDLNEKMRIRVSSEVARDLERELKSKGIDFYVITDDFQKWIDNEREENPPDDDLSARQEEFQLDVYHTFEAISDHMDLLEERYPELACVQTIGTTYEGNPIKGLKIGSGNDKPAIWIDSGIHAREWVSPATSLYIIEQLLRGYDTDPEIRQLVDTYDWYIFPVMNPDGYKFTWSADRMWRKNRSPSSNPTNSSCRGADLNRNFDVDFGGRGTSNDPCSEVYRGTSPFSEAESQAVRDSIQEIGDSLKLYISLHSYSQLWMAPYSKSKNYPPDHEDHMKVMEAACNAIKNVSGEKYKYGAASHVIYQAAGSSVDWVYEETKVKYSFAVELRDKGEEGFMLSKSKIIPTAKESFAGIRAIANAIQSEF